MSNTSLHTVEGKRILCTADVRGNIKNKRKYKRKYTCVYLTLDDSSNKKVHVI